MVLPAAVLILSPSIANGILNSSHHGETLLDTSLPVQIESTASASYGSLARRQRLGHDYTVFLSQALRSLSVTASLFPSSRFLASALLKAIDFRAASVIVELGVGTGAITKEILRRLKPNAVLLGLDLNPAFVTHVGRTTRDRRFIPILGHAEQLGNLLSRYGIGRADAIVSSLGLTSMHASQRSTIMTQAAAHLTRDGVLTQYQYLHAKGKPNWVSALGLPRFAEKEFLRAHFRDVASERVIWNLPPACVYTCRA
jgi:phosphatidylethanolamine/phosphatidyl-N-methylethanolamine N-methyltransferase